MSKKKIKNKFIGIDLGWVSGASGLCCLELNQDGLNIASLTTEIQLQDIWNWLDEWVSPDEFALVAVDAPTIIPNQTGMRPPDKLTHKHFGKYHAGCYPANLNRPFARRTVSFGERLSQKGFAHAPQIAPQQPGRYQIEVFPHPAIVNLFGLDKILKYKKGKLADKRLELIKLRDYISNILTTLQPQIYLAKSNTLPEIPDRIKGKELKDIEDRLDSLICAYVGAYWWYWGLEKNLVLGDETTGYIVVPTR